MEHRIVMAALLGASLALAGCGKSTQTSQPSPSGGGSAVDQAEVASALAADPAMVEESVYESNDPMDVQLSAGGFAAIRPLHFWRVIRSVDRRFDFEFSAPDSQGRPTRALVTVHKHLLGSFNILTGDTTGGDTARHVIHKPLDDRWVRRLALVRVRSDSTGRQSRWRIAGTSGVQVTSKDALSRIVSLRIQAGTLDTTITDILELHRLRRLVMVPTNTEVTLTATSNSSENVMLFYGHDRRLRFANNGDGSYTFRFTTGDFGGLRHFGVNALSHGTLFDDTAAYDSQAWLMPFAVRTPDADIGARR